MRKKKASKWMVLPALLTAIAVLSAGCGTGADDDLQASPSYETVDSFTGSGVYEGKWTVNKQVVDTARMVVNEAMSVRLPQSYLIGLCFPDVTDKSAPVVGSGKPTSITVYSEGYSEQSQYLAFESTTDESYGVQRLFNTCSFETTIGGLPYSISLLSRENASAVYQYATGQWTLGIPVGCFLVKNMATGQKTVKELAIAVTLYYNTNKRIL